MTDFDPDQALKEALGLHQSGRLSEAESIYRRILAQQPAQPDALHLLGYVCFQKGQPQVAIELINQAIGLRPDIPNYYNSLGTILEKSGQLVDGAVAYRTALRLDPKYTDAHSNLGNLLQSQGLFDEAIACYQAAIRLTPDYFPANFNWGNLNKEQGRAEEAVASYRRAVEAKPDLSIIHSNLLLALHYHAGCSAAEIAAEHRRWSGRHAAPLRRFIRPHHNSRDEERTLRIGYVSPDLYDHAVARFLQPLLQNHDHSRFRVYAYSDTQASDSVTNRLQVLTDVWRNTVGMEDGQLAELIRQDEIDILIDLAAHTAGNRLLVFARKPAPVQISYLAYCSTTGLDTMDYRLTDAFLDPDGTDLGDYSEQSVRLPKTYWCYLAPSVPMAVGPLPAFARGVVTFGCLNNFCKVTGTTLRIWGRILRVVPESRLLLCARTNSQRRHVLESLQAFGVDATRVTFVGIQPFADYLATYRQIDLGLDPIPFTGGTTTCDALWMGVPVVSLAGRTAVSRGGSSLLSNLGAPELVAHSEDDYVGIATELAGDRTRLASLRGSLRARLEASPIMDATGFARDFEAILRDLWRRWCRK